MLVLILFPNKLIDPCAGFACVSSSTCVVVEDDCACNEGYYPRVTTDGECTRKWTL